MRDKLFLNVLYQLNAESVSKLSAKIDELHRRFDEEKNDLYQSNAESVSKLSAKIDELHRRFDEEKYYLELSQKNAVTDLDVRVGNNVARLFSVFSIHQNSFAKFNRCNTEKAVVIVGAGPTVNNFIPIKNAIYIGLNRAFKLKEIKFNYLFAIDKGGIKDYFDEFFEYNDSDCIKFIGDQNIGIEYQIPESKIKGRNILRYITTAGQFADRFTYHIESEPLGNFQTVSLQAMQFALYTNPAKIYLVGIDCSANGHFTGKTEFTESRTEAEFKNNMTNSIYHWKKLKDFAKTYYPDTEIISVNPVGLKGIFKDWYQAEGEEPK